MKPTYAVLEQAAEWFAVMHSESLTLQERRAWQAWMVRPGHARAWAEIERISARFSAIAEQPAARRLGAALPARDLDRRQALKLLGLVCTGGALALAAAQPLSWVEWSAGQRTGVGEIRELALAADARLWLNTQSAAELLGGDAKPQVALYRGEILVESGRQPLWLRSSQGRVQALPGSRFSMRAAQGETWLNLFVGQLQISPERADALLLEAGQQVSFSRQQIVLRGQAHARREAWARGILLADNLRLDEFLLELAAYRRGYLRCDPRVGSLRVVGAFPLGDVDRVLDALADTLPIRIQRRTGWWVNVEPA